MKEVEYFNWWLPPNEWRNKPYRSNWKMTLEGAVEHGALVERGPVPGTREVRLRGETPEEEAEYQRKMHTNAWQKKFDDGPV